MNRGKKLNHDEMIPLEFHLSQNYPNPFKDKTTIKYCIPYKVKVIINIYDPEGKKIKVLVKEEKYAGTYEIEFDINKCITAKGRDPCGGIYTYELYTEEFKQKKSMIIKE